MIKTLKCIFFLFVIFLMQPIDSFAKEKKITKKIVWMENYQEARTKAKKENKLLIIFFSGEDWCPWCKKMREEILNNPVFNRKIAPLFLFCLIDVPFSSSSKKNYKEKLIKKLQVEDFPALIIVNYKENVLARMGYLPCGGEKYAKYLKIIYRELKATSSFKAKNF